MKQINLSTTTSIYDFIPYTPSDDSSSSGGDGNSNAWDCNRPFTIPDFQEFNYKMLYNDDEELIAFSSRSGNFTYVLNRDPYGDLISLTVNIQCNIFIIALIFEHYDLRVDTTVPEDKGKVVEVVLLNMCGEDYIKSLVITPSVANVAPGETYQYTATAITQDGVSLDVTDAVIWSVDSPLSVSKGLVSNTITGTYTVTATYQNEVATATLIVNPIEILVNPRSQTVDIGATATYKAYKKNPDGSLLDITLLCTWTADSPIIINSSGNVSNTITPGTYGIQATYEGNTGTATLIVFQPQLEIIPGSNTVDEGEDAQFMAFYKTYSNALDVTTSASWSVDSPLHADKGLVSNTTPPGTYTITASYKGTTATATVIVRQRDFWIDPGTIVIHQYETATFRAKYRVNGVTNDVTNNSSWEIEWPFVINNGVVTNTIALGTVVVTARYNGSVAHGTLTIIEEGEDIPPGPTPNPVTYTLQVRPGSRTVNVGEPARYKAYLVCSDGTQTNVTNLCDWDVTGPGFHIDRGYVTDTNTPGTYSVTASYGGRSADATLIVKDVVLIVTPDTQTISEGETAVYKALLDGVDVTNSATWSVNLAPLIINKGVVTNTNAIGTATITAHYGGKTATATLVIEDWHIEVRPSPQTAVIGGSAQFYAYLVTAFGETDITSLCTWSINNSFSISKGYVWNITTTGGCTVTASYNGKSGDGQLIVSDKQIVVTTQHIILQFRDSGDLIGDDAVRIKVNNVTVINELDIVEAWSSVDATLQPGVNRIDIGAVKNGYGAIRAENWVSACVRIIDTNGNILYPETDMFFEAPTSQNGTINPDIYYTVWTITLN